MTDVTLPPGWALQDAPDTVGDGALLRDGEPVAVFRYERAYCQRVDGTVKHGWSWHSLRDPSESTQQFLELEGAARDAVAWFTRFPPGEPPLAPPGPDECWDC